MLDISYPYMVDPPEGYDDLEYPLHPADRERIVREFLHRNATKIILVREGLLAVGVIAALLGGIYIGRVQASPPTMSGEQIAALKSCPTGKELRGREYSTASQVAGQMMLDGRIINEGWFTLNVFVGDDGLECLYIQTPAEAGPNSLHEQSVTFTYNIKVQPVSWKTGTPMGDPIPTG